MNPGIRINLADICLNSQIEKPSGSELRLRLTGISGRNAGTGSGGRPGSGWGLSANLTAIARIRVQRRVIQKSS
jgi:hypothetical protein